MNQGTMEQCWHNYMAAYGAHDEGERARFLEQCVSENVVFTTPAENGKTRAELFDHIGKFQQKIPGSYFTTDKVYAQADKLLAVWTLHKKDGTKVVTGYNFARPDQQGLFNYVAGFF